MKHGRFDYTDDDLDSLPTDEEIAEAEELTADEWRELLSPTDLVVYPKGQEVAERDPEGWDV